jgi:hypothetical protein
MQSHLCLTNQIQSNHHLKLIVNSQTSYEKNKAWNKIIKLHKIAIKTLNHVNFKMNSSTNLKGWWIVMLNKPCPHIVLILT